MREYFFCLLILVGCKSPTKPDDKLPEEKMKLVWEISYETAGIGINATPLLIGDSLVVMSAGREVWLLEQQNGKIRWKYLLAEQTNIQTDVFATDGVRIIATHVQDVRAWYISNGEIAWIRDIPDARGSFFFKEIVVDNNRVYVGAAKKAVCLNSVTGEIIWSKSFDTLRYIAGAQISGEKVLFTSSFRPVDNSGKDLTPFTRLMAFNKNDGTLLWSSQVNGNGGGFMPPLVSDSIAYLGTTWEFPSSFDAFDINTGARKWSYYTPNEFYHYDYAIVVGDKVIANAGWYWVCAFNKYNGNLLWRTKIVENAEYRKLHYYNGYVYHTHAWKLFILDPNTGAIVYSMKGPQKQDIVTIAVGNGRVFVQGYPSLQCYEAYKP